MVSSPSPPERISAPWPPERISAPWPPASTSSSGVPTITSPVSATVTVKSTGAVVDDVPSSLAVASTERLIVPKKSAGGVSCKLLRLANSAGSSIVQVPSKLSVPSESIAPVGIPEIVTLRSSEPSISVVAADTSRSIAVSSSPDASFAPTVGSSATPETGTLTGLIV